MAAYGRRGASHQAGGWVLEVWLILYCFKDCPEASELDASEDASLYDEVGPITSPILREASIRLPTIAAWSCKHKIVVLSFVLLHKQQLAKASVFCARSNDTYIQARKKFYFQARSRPLVLLRRSFIFPIACCRDTPHEPVHLCTQVCQVLMFQARNHSLTVLTSCHANKPWLRDCNGSTIKILIAQPRSLKFRTKQTWWFITKIVYLC